MTKQMRNLTLALAAMMAAGATAQDRVQLASWTFESAYAEDGTNPTVYTPAEGTAADITGWFNSTYPVVRADAQAGDAADYYVSAWSEGRYYQICGGYNTRVLRIDQTTANAVTDYTNPTQHKAYFEVVFPSKGYKNVQIEYAIAPGNNTASAFEAVVSTDGGNTWFDAGSNVTSAAWWLYDKNTVNLSANNKDQVKVRLVSPNDVTTNWNLDYVTVTAEADAGAAPINATDATIVWPYDLGAANPVAAEVSAEGATSSTSFVLGSNLYFNGVQAANGVTFSKLNPVEGISKAREENSYVKFTVIPKKGVAFTPKTLKLKSCKFGTSGGTFDVVAVRGAQTVTLATGIDPERNNTGFTAYDYDLSAFDASEERIDVYFYVYNLVNNKQIGLSDVQIIGDFAGTPAQLPVYTLSLACGTEGAGNVASVPAGTEFDEGTEITVTATENFGYHFQSWTDAEGNEVSTSNPYTFSIEANTALVAQYTENNVYAINLTLAGGANPNLVEFQPAGNVVDGIHHYEEGTEVKLVALNNRILTFTNWSDNSTAPTLELVMDSDKDITANFACEDYIVAWDLYNDDPASERAADYKAESDNAGLLSLHNAEGGTMSWLAGGVNKGKQNGRYCARVWRPFSAGYYFEISFSSVGYSNLKLSAALGNDFPSYKIYNAEYSVDGTNYVPFGEWVLPYRGWTEHEYALPAEADNQARVYIRFMADKTSGFEGANAETANESTTDGFSIADIYVLADADAANDEVAPVLVSSLPGNGATDVSANGQIILTFDEKIVAGTCQATLGDETLKGRVSGKTVAFSYAGLKYATDYTFSMPAGAVTDRSGNPSAAITLSFTTMERVQPEARLYDAVVAQDGTGDYTTVQEAIDAAPQGRVKPWLIFVKKGTYNEHVNIPASKPYIHLIGQDRDLVSITDNKLCGGDNALPVNEGATVVALSNDLFFEGISFENSWGIEQNNGPQALALNTQGDRIAFNNVKMRSYQDTWITTSQANNRHYVNNSWIEGAVDFIYNSGNIFVENSTIYIVRKSGGYIVAPRHYENTEWGYVFVNNTITAPGVPSETSVWLGRPWHDFPKTVFINTVAEVTIPATGWYETMGGLPVLWADYNTMDGNGNPVDLSQRRDTYYYTDANGERVYGTAKNYLTDEEAAQYTVKNVLSGSDNWQPAIMAEACDAPKAVINENEITWEAVPYAICYVVTRDGEVIDFTTECSCDYVEGSTYTIQAVNEFGGLSEAAEATKLSAIAGVEVPCARIAGIYSIDGVALPQMQRGINIVRYETEDGRTIVKKVVY